MYPTIVLFLAILSTWIVIQYFVTDTLDHVKHGESWRPSIVTLIFDIPCIFIWCWFYYITH